ncbi:MAG: CAP domain-containing protein [Methanobrevibacter sp.]|nr:CAP domain-containing protein [Methanobrevibacter sp.]
MVKLRNFRILKILLLILFVATSSSFLIKESYAEESEVLRLINKERAANSLQPLKIDKELTLVAKIRCEEIKTHFSHTRPDGSRGLNISTKVKGENIAAGHKTPKEVVSAWMKSPSHRKNILHPHFTTIGISHKKTGTGHKYYWVKLFGTAKVKKIKLEKVKNLKTKSKKNQITLMWKKQRPSIATGYEIFVYNPKAKNYKLFKKITNYNTNNLIIVGLESSTTYQYRIRSYKVINKIVYHGSSSTIITRTK